jgi:5,10-methylenetetrahydromethanopterin reductase
MHIHKSGGPTISCVRLGISFGALYEDSGTVIRYLSEAEKLGYFYAFLPDSQMVYRDPFTCLGAASLATKSIVLGTMVSPVNTRHPTVLANAFRTVQEITGGRALFVVGRGDSSVRRIGEKPVNIEDFISAVHGLKAILAGKQYQDLFSMRGTPVEVPILVMASGPKMIKASGWVGDGSAVLTGPDLAEWAYRQIEQGAIENGCRIADRRLVFTCFCSISDDRHEALALVKPAVLWFCTNSRQLVDSLGLGLSEKFWSEVGRMAADYARYDFVHEEDWRKAVDEAAFIPDELASSLSLTGTSEEIAAKLEKVGLFFKDVVIRPVASHLWYGVFRRFAEEVIPEVNHL